MTVKEIVTNYLKENGYDGLCGNDCECLLDDLLLCDDAYEDYCEPAYRYEYLTDEEADCSKCDSNCYSNYDQIMLPVIKTDCPALKRAPIGGRNE
jgi:hypothetical protein